MSSQLINTINRLNTELNRLKAQLNGVNAELLKLKNSNALLDEKVKQKQIELDESRRNLINEINKVQRDLTNERTRAIRVAKEAKEKETGYMKTLYKQVYNQNQALLGQQTSMRDSYSTDDQKVYYQAIEIQYLSYYNYILMIIYYILAAICVIILFFRQETIKNIYVKGVLAILILTYLYTIPYVESLVYNLLAMSSSLIYGDVYLMKY
jgi:hypothetical protein